MVEVVVVLRDFDDVDAWVVTLDVAESFGAEDKYAVEFVVIEAVEVVVERLNVL